MSAQRLSEAWPQCSTGHQRGRLGRPRRGVESIEVAVALPMLLITMFTTVSITHHWHVQKLLKLAAAEAMKAGAAKEGTAADAKRIFDEHCAALGIAGAELEIDENSFNNAVTGDELVLKGIAPTSQNSVISPVSINMPATISGGWIHYRKEGY